MIIEDSEGSFQSKNIEQHSENNQEYLRKLSLKFSDENTPIEVIYQGKTLINNLLWKFRFTEQAKILPLYTCLDIFVV